MNYAELKAIIQHLKKEVNCHVCHRKFSEESMWIVSAMADEALFHFSCFKCRNQLLVHVSIVEKGNKPAELSIHTQPTNPVTKNDILDTHNFLNRFNGDFKKLFSQAE